MLLRLDCCKKRSLNSKVTIICHFFQAHASKKESRFSCSKIHNFVRNNCSAVSLDSDISVGVANWHLSSHFVLLAKQANCTIKAFQSSTGAFNRCEFISNPHLLVMCNLLSNALIISKRYLDIWVFERYQKVLFWPILHTGPKIHVLSNLVRKCVSHFDR